MPVVNINGTEHEFEDGLTLIQACEQAGVEIPRFCYHERLKIAGNCRMCLVEAVGAPKPVASCAMGVNDLRPGRDGSPPMVRTDSELVKKAREGVMEFLLINHPLDCPICDQGGECDLQDQAMYYGRDESRYEEGKRSVEDKYLGPLIKTHMTRCIHCTRCVRFMEDVAGVPELGATGRGESVEITTYIEQALHSEMSANIVDLCPVGALTSKPYAFHSRPWENTRVETIDVMDAVGSNIRVDVRGNAIMRVLPRLNEDINEEWISDKTRYACDGLKAQRLDRPYIRKQGRLVPADWDEALSLVATKLGDASPDKVAAIAGDQACVESMIALKDVMTQYGVSSIDCRQSGEYLPNTQRGDYLFNTTIAGLEDADFVLLVGTNPRLEAPIVNARVRKRYLTGQLTIARIGEAVDLTYPVHELGEDPSVLHAIAQGNHAIIDAIKQASNPAIIVGTPALSRHDSDAIYNAARAIADQHMQRDNWQSFNVLHHAAARVGGLDVGFTPAQGGMELPAILAAADAGDIDVVYLLQADELDMRVFADSFVVYQGHHGDAGAAAADVIFPGSAYTEKQATYVNLEGRVQRTTQAAFPPGEAKEDWKIIRALAEKCGKHLSYNTHQQLLHHIKLNYPYLSVLHDIIDGGKLGALSYSPDDVIDQAPFFQLIHNFYMTDPISRASKVMAACSRDVAGLGVEEAA